MANREELTIIRNARAGQAAAQVALGRLYLLGGSSLPRSTASALHWLDRAARQDVREAWSLIGSHVPFEAASQSGQPMALCVWYERAFEDGDLEAGLVLAKLVLGSAPGAGPDGQPLGPGLRTKAMRALTLAARAGLPDAQWLLARHGAADGNGASGGRTPGWADVGADSSPGAASDSPRDTAQGSLDWAERAAEGGVPEARMALAEQAWGRSDWQGFLRWALPLARGLLHHLQSGGTPASWREGAAWPAPDGVALLLRCAQALSATGDDESDELHSLWEAAALEGNRMAQLGLGLWWARMDAAGARRKGGGSANFKKAARWLELAGGQGLAEAWHALSRIYLKPEFSRRSMAEAQACLERAASLGHCGAQWECGAAAWRTRREADGNDVRAAFWLQKAAAQGSAEAAALLEKVAPPTPPAAWAQEARGLLTREMAGSHPFIAARVEMAALFSLTRAEALLLDVGSADHGHCLVVDVRAHHGRAKRRLVLLRTAQERQALDRIARLFEDVGSGPDGPEGNYRQRLYRLKSLFPQLAEPPVGGGGGDGLGGGDCC